MQKLLSCFASALGLVGLSLFLAGHAGASPLNQNIVSDSSWKSSNTFVQGWEQTSFNDTAWSAARAPYPTPSEFGPNVVIPGTSAQPIWHDPAGTSDGTTGDNEVFLRKSFTLSMASDSLPLLGQALINVDDDYDFFVNGQLAFSNHDQGTSLVSDFVDFGHFLRNGENVFAIHAVDGAWGHPADRIYERVILDARIATVTIAPVPEPEIYAMLLAGLGRTSFMARRKKGIS
jgi:hypothetical protein